MIKQLLKPLNLKFLAVFGAQPQSSLSHKMSRPLFEIKNQILDKDKDILSKQTKFSENKF